MHNDVTALQAVVQNQQQVIAEITEQIKDNARAKANPWPAVSDVYKRTKHKHFFQNVPPKDLDIKVEWDTWSASLKDDLAG